MTNSYFFSPSTGGFYHSSINSEIPEDAKEISADVYEGLMSAQDSGAEIVAGPDGEPMAQEPQIDVAAVKSSLAAKLDAAAESERLKYITPGAGQAMTYQQKADEALRYLGATTPEATDYPLLSAEVGITASDVAGVATVVSNAYKQWQIVGAKIEAARLRGKAAIAAAIDAASAEAAFSAVTWP